MYKYFGHDGSRAGDGHLPVSKIIYLYFVPALNSFFQAAQEASISRVYGGIHYKFSVDTGAEKGRKLGDFIVERLMN